MNFGAYLRSLSVDDRSLIRVRIVIIVATICVHSSSGEHVLDMAFLLLKYLLLLFSNLL